MRSTRLFAIAMPSPVPSSEERDGTSSRSNGSKMCATNSGDMPTPSSSTTNFITRKTCPSAMAARASHSPSAHTRSASSPSSSVTENRTVPYGSVYFTALPSRLMSTWLTRTSSPTTKPGRTSQRPTTKSKCFVSACGRTIETSISTKSHTSNGAWPMSMRPLSILLMSSTSFTKFSR